MNLRKILFLSVIYLLTAGWSIKAENAAELFANAPQEVFPLLDSSTRLDMIDYFNSGMDTPSANALQGKSAITSMTDQTVEISLTDSSCAQLAIIQSSKGDTIIAVINTVATPGLDSSISFFTTDWQPINAAGLVKIPTLKEWLSDTGKGHYDEVSMQVPFMLSSYNISSDGATLTMTNNLDKFVDPDIYADLQEYLLPNIVYIWNGKKFLRK